MEKYECHVTIEPVFDERLEELKELVKPFRFKVADLIMKKTFLDKEEPSKKDTFMTGHSTNWEDIQSRMINLITEVENNNYKIFRYKIEEILLDSREEDIFRLLKENTK